MSKFQHGDRVRLVGSQCHATVRMPDYMSGVIIVEKEHVSGRWCGWPAEHIEHLPTPPATEASATTP